MLYLQPILIVCSYIISVYLFLRMNSLKEQVRDLNVIMAHMILREHNIDPEEYFDGSD